MNSLIYPIEDQKIVREKPRQKVSHVQSAIQNIFIYYNIKSLNLPTVKILNVFIFQNSYIPSLI